eukprot:CAMPEP_0113574556 /NCGR_PEP_ID=MMETSP0015_2-20120614/27210_1 /TAXON_ID=2838 /ORGANISM="Odontella" /LENGTH=514 /DNA_ID=CAMNT_0000477701 /DNA_START=1 /DNA_END=1545 /DNA_ORIENTATION=+ /assembly_acc=CAM_ASM_000160
MTGRRPSGALLLKAAALSALAATAGAFAPSPAVSPAGGHARASSSSSAAAAAATTRLRSTAGDDAASVPGQLSRRQLAELTVAGLGIGVSFLGTRETKPTDYGLWGILPIGTYKTKKTIMETIVPGQVWTFDQKFGILNVQVPLRMTVVKLAPEAGGGLFVYDAVAATPECVSMLRELEKVHGPVRHIALGTVAIEHKTYAGVLAQKFPKAKVWLQSGQYSFPSNLPDTFLGFPTGRTFPMPKNIDEAPAEWKASGLDLRTLGPFISKDGAFGETVFFHEPTKTLLCTDTVLEVTDEVPAIYDTDPNPLLYHARDTITEVVEDTPEVRKRGWRRVVLFGLFFQPSAIKIKDAGVAFDERRPDINSDFAGIYPWDWIGDDDASFDALKGGLLVAPILQKLILNRSPVEVLDFADEVAKWPIERIIPAHLKNDLKYTGKDYRAAFSFLEAGGVPRGLPKPLDADFQTLADAEVNLLESGAISKCPPLVGGDVSREEILAQTAYNCRAGTCTPRSSP